MAQKVPHSFIVYLYGREFQNELSFRMLQYAEKIQLQRNTSNSKLVVHKKENESEQSEKCPHTLSM